MIFLRWSLARFTHSDHSTPAGSHTMQRTVAVSSLGCSVISVTDKTHTHIGNSTYPNNELAACELIRPRQPRETSNLKPRSNGHVLPGQLHAPRCFDIWFHISCTLRS